MPEATIPAPTEEDFRTVTAALGEVMLRHNVQPVGAFGPVLKDLLDVQAHQRAEIRFLRNIIHLRGKK